MSIFHVTIEVGDPQAQRFEELRALVDTGATYTWIPDSVLRSLGHQPTLKRQLRTADNRIIERGAGFVPIRIGEETNPSLCIFGDEGSQVLLGAFTLEGFCVAPDPVNEKLIPVVAMLATILE